MAEDLDNSIEEVLSLKFDYYRKLNIEDRQRFLARVLAFMQGKEFIPREQVELTASIDEMKTIISAAAVQLTFGLEEYTLDPFYQILIYPSSFYNNVTHNKELGEASPRGTLVFSWKDLQEGFAEGTDKINVGIHEMSHALHMSRNAGKCRDIFFTAYFDRWVSVTHEEFLKLESHQASFFRDYGGTNIFEFFAVCMECFFEAADEFNEKHPEIYKQTCILLNQDPTTTFNSSSAVRDKLLSLVADVTPATLVFKTRGESSFHIISTFISLFLAACAIIGTGLLGAAGALLVFIIFLAAFITIFFSSVLVYEVYDNAFVVSHESFGKKTGEDLIQPGTNTVGKIPSAYGQVWY